MRGGLYEIVDLSPQDRSDDRPRAKSARPEHRSGRRLLRTSITDIQMTPPGQTIERGHHYPAASEPERAAPAITRSSALEALKHGPLARSSPPRPPSAWSLRVCFSSTSCCPFQGGTLAEQLNNQIASGLVEEPVIQRTRSAGSTPWPVFRP